MPTWSTLMGFALVSAGMVLSPGPNMIYLLSRSICQGRAAGLLSLCGIAMGFIVYMLCAAFGITALALTVPFAYDLLRFSGAAYLLYLAWMAVRPGGKSPFEVRDLPPDRGVRLVGIGLVTSLLNPKVAVLYGSLLPQFVDPRRGSVLHQSLALGTTQIIISVLGNALITVCAGSIAAVLARRPQWMLMQRWIMATVLGGLACKMAVQARR